MLLVVAGSNPFGSQIFVHIPGIEIKHSLASPRSIPKTVTMSNKDSELLGCLLTRKGGYVKRAIQRIEAAFQVKPITRPSSAPPPPPPTTPQQYTAKATTTTTTSTAVKLRIERLEHKIHGQSETKSGDKSTLLLTPIVRSNHQFSPRYAFSPKRNYHKLSPGWDNDDDTTVSTVSISSMSFSSSSSTGRRPVDIGFVGRTYYLKEKNLSTKLFRSPSSSDDIQNFGHISILDSSYDGLVIPSSPHDYPSDEDSEQRGSSFSNYYCIFSVILLSVKGAVDPAAICTVYLLLEIFRLSKKE